MSYVRATNRMKRLAAIICALILLLPFFIPYASYAESAESKDKEKVVRVGCHEVPYFITDKFGRRSGYSYEYQCKLAAYTGWTYEYVDGTWSDLFRMLMNGEIDVMSNISYTDARAEKILYSSMPMGTESYYVYVSPDNKEISADDNTSLNGKRVGVTKDSFQKEEFIKWAEQHGIEAELVEMSCSDEESISMLGSKFDAFVTMDVYGDPEKAVPVVRIGSSDFYFAVRKDRPDLMSELDAAMIRIQEENAFYSEQLHEKYLRNNVNQYLSAGELEWLESHGAIKVGYQDNYLAFCARDGKTGELTGALKDYLSYARDAVGNAKLEFEAIAYPTAADAVEALKKGEVDCVFPANLSDYDSEQLGVVMSPAIMRTEMDAIVRADEQKEFIRKSDVIVAVNEGNTNYDMFLADHYPNWERAYFADTPAALEAVAAGDADCVIISNYRFNNISKICDRLHLASVYTGVDMDYCFALRRGDTDLYSILARVTNEVPDSAVHTALTYYSTEDVRMSFFDLVRENLLTVLLMITAVLLLFLILILRSIRMEKLAREEEHLVDDLNKRVYVDALTSVRNKRAFADYVSELQKQTESGELTDFAIAILDCDDLKQINDGFGHDKGDAYLKAASRLICNVFKHSPVFRIGGDEFAAVLRNDDFKNREELAAEFDRRQKELCGTAENKWEEVKVAIGIAVYDPHIDDSVNDTVRRADKLMYDNKRRGKDAGRSETE